MKIFLILGLMCSASVVLAAGPAPVQKPFGANPQPSVVMGGAVVNAVPRGQVVPPAMASASGRAVAQGRMVRDFKLSRKLQAQEQANLQRQRGL